MPTNTRAAIAASHYRVYTQRAEMRGVTPMTPVKFRAAVQELGELACDGVKSQRIGQLKRELGIRKVGKNE